MSAIATVETLPIDENRPISEQGFEEQTLTATSEEFNPSIFDDEPESEMSKETRIVATGSKLRQLLTNRDTTRELRKGISIESWAKLKARLGTSDPDRIAQTLMNGVITSH